MSDLQKPLIQEIYGNQASQLPLVLQKRYANRPFSKDTLLMKGEMNIVISTLYRMLSPLFRLSGALVPYPAKNIPTTVALVSDETSNEIIMHRTFYYPDKSPYHFTSKVIHIKDNIVI